jgi:phage shock protein C
MAAARKKTRPKARPAARRPAGRARKKRAAAARPAGSVKRPDIDQRVEHFGGEVGRMGEKLGRHMERKGKEWESSWERTFGITGPFISSIFGLIVIAIALWILNIVNLPLGNVFISNVYWFVFSNLALFFAFLLFFSYASYFNKRHREGYIPFSPIVTAIGITIGFWLLMWVINIIGMSFQSTGLSAASAFIQLNLFGIFMLFLVLGYAVLFVMLAMGRIRIGAERHVREEIRMAREKTARRPAAGEIRRLYRSGRDRILGGVCGGIAEYLQVDPVLIRLIWIVASLAWGSGILAYLIAWVIIPRNPEDRWNR